MIFEVRTYLLTFGAIPQADAVFAATLPARIKLSRLAALCLTDTQSDQSSFSPHFSPLY
ncbi:MAG: hypothetical protein JSR91_14065 [Proteobacteria bacterium]|nr:hypothetical protein [Pseudomonadota bacterium]